MQEAQELGSALGYLLLYLELAASYLGTPLLNQVPLAANQYVLLRLITRTPGGWSNPKFRMNYIPNPKLNEGDYIPYTPLVTQQSHNPKFRQRN
jgi:hypothetical protein